MGRWPALFDSSNSPVQVVVADINYGMMRLVDEEPVTLEQYLSPLTGVEQHCQILIPPPVRRV